MAGDEENKDSNLFAAGCTAILQDTLSNSNYFLRHSSIYVVFPQGIKGYQTFEAELSE